MSGDRSGADPAAAPGPGIRGLFQQRVAGDDALLRLAALRFARAGMPGELYARTPQDAERLLHHLPAHDTLPTVHLDRSLDLLSDTGRDTVLAFVAQLGDRVAGLVVHDKAPMLDRLPEVVDALCEVGDRSHGPHVFLEYAFGAPPDWFVEVAARTATLGRAGVCLDTGHVGLATVRRDLARLLPDAGSLTVDDPALPSVVGSVQQATAAALPAVLRMTRDLADAGATVHFHLHDGHPLIPRLSDHVSFLTRVPVPFAVDGARSLAPMFGPTGLAAIVQTATEALRPGRLSLTLEVHQADGRLPLDPEAARLFAHWTDLTNAERFNYWLSVVVDNYTLATALAR